MKREYSNLAKIFTLCVPLLLVLLSTYGDIKKLIGYILISFVLLILFLINYKKYRLIWKSLIKNMAFMLIIAGFVFGLIYSPHHREALIVILSSLIIPLQLLIITKSNNLKYFLFIGCAIALMVSVINNNHLSNLAGTSDRIDTQKVAFKIATMYPISGVGLGGMDYHYPAVYEMYLKKPINTNVGQPGNFYEFIWLNCGMLGLLGFMYAIKQFWLNNKTIGRVATVILMVFGLAFDYLTLLPMSILIIYWLFGNLDSDTKI